jgi:hypothetical protein
VKPVGDYRMTLMKPARGDAALGEVAMPQRPQNGTAPFYSRASFGTGCWHLAFILLAGRG